jgi:hypothetical protein
MKAMKTNIKLFAALAALAMVACQEPVEVPPTTTSLGINSVSATFLKGDLASNKMAVFTTKVTSLEEDIVIAVPWFFPEDSDNVITDITEMRVTASMDYNCFLEPGLCVLDLTKENAQPEVFLPYDGTLYYGLTICPYTGDVYIADAIDYVQQGMVYRYSKERELIDKFYVGIIPGAFCWK